jgi:hypothetical protein
VRAALDLDDLTTVYVEQQTEYLVCTDPGSTQVRSDCRYRPVAGGFERVEAAATA